MPEKTPVTGPRIRVFLVDDHPLVREWLGNLLGQQSDMEVSGHAEDSAGALQAMRAAPPDVAIVDLSLRRSSGLDLIKDLGEQVPQTKILVLSMHEEIDYGERSFRAGARGYIIKRESTSRVVEAIRKVHAGEIYASRELLVQLAERLLGRQPDAAAKGHAELLSDRELEVFRRLGQGHTTRRIAEELHLSMKTVQAYCARIKEKLGLGGAAELVREAVRWTEAENRR